LDTTALRVFKDIERVDLDITLRMPWQRTGKVPDYDKVSDDVKAMCYEYGLRMAEAKVNDFTRHELNSSLIDTRRYIKFDEAWVEPWYESAQFKERDAKHMRELAEKRAAERAAKVNIVKDSRMEE
jgi:hypothetical protein